MTQAAADLQCPIRFAAAWPNACCAPPDVSSAGHERALNELARCRSLRSRQGDAVDNAP